MSVQHHGVFSTVEMDLNMLEGFGQVKVSTASTRAAVRWALSSLRPGFITDEDWCLCDVCFVLPYKVGVQN